jgi:hypothetical protein
MKLVAEYVSNIHVATRTSIKILLNLQDNHILS